MIPFERDPGSPRDPIRRSGDGDAHAAPLRGAVDPALLAPPVVARRAPSALESLAGWLVAPLCLAAVGAGLLLVLRGPDQLFGVTFGLVLALGLAWIVGSSLFPGRADRTCPSCGRPTLSRLDARTTHGLRCRSCPWRDESASSFLLAEDDGAPFEDIVLRERRQPRRF